MEVTCPDCCRPIPLEDINVSTDIALCRNCKTDFSLASLLADSGSEIDLDRPPAGAWYGEDRNQIEIGATTRSAGAFLLVPFTVVWAGGSMTGIYGTQIASGEFNPILCLFGLPFLIGSILLISQCVMHVAGKIVVTIDRDNLTVFTGVSQIGRTKEFRLDDISAVGDGQSNITYSGQGSQGISLSGTTAYTFGTLLNEERKYFVLNALRHLLAQRRQALR